MARGLPENFAMCIIIVSVLSTQLCGHLCGDVFLFAKPSVHAYYGVAYNPVVYAIPKSPFIVITQWHVHSLGCEEKTTTKSVSVPHRFIKHCLGMHARLKSTFHNVPLPPHSVSVHDNHQPMYMYLHVCKIE